MLITMKIVCVLFFLLCRVNGLAQEDEKVKDIIENLAGDITEENDLSEFTERLDFFRKHPIDLNLTTQEQLKQLFFLSPLQISIFFSYRKKGTRLLDVLELQGIPGFDVETVSRMLPYVKVKLPETEGLTISNLYTEGRNDLILRYSRLLQKQRGFNDLPGSRYLGTPEKILLRYRYNFSEMISAALVMEKDAGETLLNKKTGLDHLSGHLALLKAGRIKKLVAGDYSMQFGQGLTLWSGFAFGKGADVTSVAARDVGLKPYTSSNEVSFFRGLACTIDLGRNIHFSPFISSRKLDASLKALPGGGFTLSNINQSGLHRTATELKNHGNLGQLVYGAALQHLGQNLNIGLIAYKSHYQHSFITGTQSYNRYGFTGKKLINSGFHYNYTFRNVYFYGEAAHSLKSGSAMINGAMAPLSKKTSVVLLYRNYDKDYHNFFSKAVGESTEPSNEKGWYAGFNYTLFRNLTWSVYGDYFKFPWLRYRVDSPSTGYEMLSQLNYTKAKVFKVILRFKREQKQQNSEAEDSSRTTEAILKQNYRMEWTWKLNQKFHFQQRTEVSQYQKGINKNETGYLFYQDIDYKPMSSRLSANIRFAWFNTPSYNSRIYAYENDVLYGAGSGIYSGKGIRTYMNLRYRPLKKMDIWTRYSISIYRNTERLSSGLDEIIGNKKSELKLQLRYQF